MLVNVAKTGLKYVFDDKMDAGGNSNMIKLFDRIRFIIHFSTIESSGFDADLQLYDTMPKNKISIIMNDRTQTYKMTIGSGFAAEERNITIGSVHLSDEMKFYKNGQPIDSDEGSLWYNGEHNNGRWSEEDDVLMRVRTKNARVYNAPVDLEAWKDFVPSYVEE